MPAKVKPATSSAAMQTTTTTPKKVMKVMKVNHSGPIKRPSANLSPSTLGRLGAATLDDKIALYSKKGYDNIDGFLSGLAKEHREALWQRFKYARHENAELGKSYDQVAKGAKSVENKKQLLNIFLKLGQSCRGQPYVDALTQLTFSKGTKTTEEWVPFATISRKYGLQELMRRVKKGTVAVRTDPHDAEEYEFQDVRKLEVGTSHETHNVMVSRKDKISLEDYMKVRSASSAGASLGDSTAAHGFMAKLTGSKTALPIEDEARGEDTSDEQELEAKAELLTQFKNMGAKGKPALQRVDEMIDMMKALMSKHPKDQDKDVFTMISKRLTALQNLKKDKKMDMESCKATLMDAASTIKKVNKLK